MLNNRVEQILWQFPDPIFAINNDYFVEYANASFEKLANQPINDLVQKHIQEIDFNISEGWTDFLKKVKEFTNDKLEGTQHQISDSINDPLAPQKSQLLSKKPHSLVIRGKEYFYVFYKVQESENTNQLSTIIFREKTKSEEVSTRMIQTERMSGLGTLAAGFAHEFNNPLYAIIGLSEMIIAEKDMDKINSISQKIVDNSKKMASVIENLAVYSKTSNIKDLEAVNINERMDAAMELALLGDYSRTITVNKNYCSLPLLKARPEEIEQIFFNIFSNSIQAMKGKGSINISSLRVNDKSIVISIQDTGEGIQKEFVPRVFDPFFTTKDQSQGTGLGLTSAYQLVKKYNGKIDFNSVLGKGSTVIIEWPLDSEISF